MGQSIYSQNTSKGGLGILCLKMCKFSVRLRYLWLYLNGELVWLLLVKFFLVTRNLGI